MSLRAMTVRVSEDTITDLKNAKRRFRLPISRIADLGLAFACQGENAERLFAFEEPDNDESRNG